MTLFLKKLKLEQIQGYPCNMATPTDIPYAFWREIEKESDGARARSQGLRKSLCSPHPSSKLVPWY